MANNTIKIYRDVYDVKTIYIDEDSAAKKIRMDWSDWLETGASIASVTWKTQNSTTDIVVSDTSQASGICTAYLNATKNGLSVPVKCTIVTDDTVPQTESRSILVKTARTY